MELIEVKGIKYQVLRSPNLSTYEYYVGVAKNHPDFFVLKKPDHILFCKLIANADLISEDGYLYSSC